MRGEDVSFKAVLEGGTDAGSMILFDPRRAPDRG